MSGPGDPTKPQQTLSVPVDTSKVSLEPYKVKDGDNLTDVAAFLSNFSDFELTAEILYDINKSMIDKRNKEKGQQALEERWIYPDMILQVPMQAKSQEAKEEDEVEVVKNWYKPELALKSTHLAEQDNTRVALMDIREKPSIMGIKSDQYLPVNKAPTLRIKYDMNGVRPARRRFLWAWEKTENEHEWKKIGLMMTSDDGELHNFTEYINSLKNAEGLKAIQNQFRSMAYSPLVSHYLDESKVVSPSMYTTSSASTTTFSPYQGSYYYESKRASEKVENLNWENTRDLILDAVIPKSTLEILNFDFSSPKITIRKENYHPKFLKAPKKDPKRTDEEELKNAKDFTTEIKGNGIKPLKPFFLESDKEYFFVFCPIDVISTFSYDVPFWEDEADSFTLFSDFGDDIMELDLSDEKATLTQAGATFSISGTSEPNQVYDLEIPVSCQEYISSLQLYEAITQLELVSYGKAQQPHQEALNQVNHQALNMGLIKANELKVNGFDDDLSHAQIDLEIDKIKVQINKLNEKKAPGRGPAAAKSRALKKLRKRVKDLERANKAGDYLQDIQKFSQSIVKEYLDDPMKQEDYTKYVEMSFQFLMDLASNMDAFNSSFGSNSINYFKQQDRIKELQTKEELTPSEKYELQFAFKNTNEILECYADIFALIEELEKSNVINKKDGESYAFEKFQDQVDDYEAWFLNWSEKAYPNYDDDLLNTLKSQSITELNLDSKIAPTTPSKPTEANLFIQLVCIFTGAKPEEFAETDGAMLLEKIVSTYFANFFNTQQGFSSYLGRIINFYAAVKTKKINKLLESNDSLKNLKKSFYNSIRLTGKHSKFNSLMEKIHTELHTNLELEKQTLELQKSNADLNSEMNKVNQRLTELDQEIDGREKRLKKLTNQILLLRNNLDNEKVNLAEVKLRIFTLKQSISAHAKEFNANKEKILKIKAIRENIDFLEKHAKRIIQKNVEINKLSEQATILKNNLIKNRKEKATLKSKFNSLKKGKSPGRFKRNAMAKWLQNNENFKGLRNDITEYIKDSRALKTYDFALDTQMEIQKFMSEKNIVGSNHTLSADDLGKRYVTLKTGSPMSTVDDWLKKITTTDTNVQQRSRLLHELYSFVDIELSKQTAELAKLTEFGDENALAKRNQLLKIKYEKKQQDLKVAQNTERITDQKIKQIEAELNDASSRSRLTQAQIDSLQQDQDLLKAQQKDLQDRIKLREQQLDDVRSNYDKSSQELPDKINKHLDDFNEQLTSHVGFAILTTGASLVSGFFSVMAIKGAVEKDKMTWQDYLDVLAGSINLAFSITGLPYIDKKVEKFLSKASTNSRLAGYASFTSGSIKVGMGIVVFQTWLADLKEIRKKKALGYEANEQIFTKWLHLIAGAQSISAQIKWEKPALQFVKEKVLKRALFAVVRRQLLRSAIVRLTTALAATFISGPIGLALMVLSIAWDIYVFYKEYTKSNMQKSLESFTAVLIEASGDFLKHREVKGKLIHDKNITLNVPHYRHFYDSPDHYDEMVEILFNKLDGMVRLTRPISGLHYLENTERKEIFIKLKNIGFLEHFDYELNSRFAVDKLKDREMSDTRIKQILKNTAKEADIEKAILNYVAPNSEGSAASLFFYSIHSLELNHEVDNYVEDIEDLKAVEESENFVELK